MELDELKEISPLHAENCQRFIKSLHHLCSKMIEIDPLVVLGTMTMLSINVFMNLYISNEEIIKSRKELLSGFFRSVLPLLTLYDKFEEMSAIEFGEEYRKLYAAQEKELDHKKVKELLEQYHKPMRKGKKR